MTRIHDSDPALWERLVRKLLTAMGHGSRGGTAEHLGRCGDSGVDGAIRQDLLGLERVYVQAKRYAAHRTVGRPDIQVFVGALYGFQANRGVFMTTSRFIQDARAYADKVASRVMLTDGDRLAGLPLKKGIRVQDAEAYVITRLDESWFE